MIPIKVRRPENNGREMAMFQAVDVDPAAGKDGRTLITRLILTRELPRYR